MSAINISSMRDIQNISGICGCAYVFCSMSDVTNIVGMLMVQAWYCKCFFKNISGMSDMTNNSGISGTKSCWQR